MLYKLYILLFGYFISVQSTFADLQTDIIPTSNDVLSWVPADGNMLDAVLWYVRDSIFWVMALIAIGVFLYIGFKLVVARWNPEEFKKALNTLIYAVIGIFIVSFAWAAVRLVAGLNI